MPSTRMPDHARAIFHIAKIEKQEALDTIDEIVPLGVPGKANLIKAEVLR